MSGPTGAITTAVFTLLGSDQRFRVDPDGIWSLRYAAPPPSLSQLRYAVVDVEATGGSPASGDRIIEIAIVQVTRGQVGEVWHTLVNPGRSLPFGVQDLTGINGAMTLRAPWFEHIAPDVAERLEGRVFVGHNVGFDFRFVMAELNEALGSVPKMRRLCTIRMTRLLLPSLRRRNLDALSRHYRIVNHARHRADGDALATARVLVRLLDEACARGVRDLDSLERLLAGVPPGRRTRRPRQLPKGHA